MGSKFHHQEGCWAMRGGTLLSHLRNLCAVAHYCLCAFINESWCMRLSHGAWVMAYGSTKTQLRTMCVSMSHGTYEWVVTHMNQPTQTRACTHTHTHTHTHTYTYTHIHAHTHTHTRTHTHIHMGNDKGTRGPKCACIYMYLQHGFATWMYLPVCCALYVCVMCVCALQFICRSTGDIALWNRDKCE